MIENKRFHYVIDNGKDTIYDLSENGDILENMLEIENMMNQLDNENQRLHDEVFRLRTELAYDRTVNDGKDWFKAEDEHLKWKSGEND